MGYFCVVVGVRDSYVGYCGGVVGDWDCYVVNSGVGYCGVTPGVWDFYLIYCYEVALLSGCLMKVTVV